MVSAFSPGKSLLSDCILEVLDKSGGTEASEDAVFTFRRQLNRFTTPEELFGPLSVKGLERDVHTRLTRSYLPTATLAFLDEAFKVGTAMGPIKKSESRKNWECKTNTLFPSCLAFAAETGVWLVLPQASSSILNSLLTVLNERTFCEDGSCEIPNRIPLLMCIFASNEVSRHHSCDFCLFSCC